MELKSERIDVADAHGAVELFFQRRWTDGLAIVPPTEEKVQEMVRYAGRDPAEVLGEIPPYRGVATIEKLAINSVMAGCLPEHFPVVIAAVEALLEPEANLNGIQTTQSSVEPLIIVNGPIAKELGVNATLGVFGRGYRANGTIGRALRLVLWNLGRNFPGEPDRSTYSHPGAWSYCIAEDEDGNPWQPLHVERGLPVGSSAVTVFSCEAPIAVSVRGNAEQCLFALCEAIAYPGCNCYRFLGGGSQLLIGMTSLSAEQFHRENWSKADIKRYVWEHARVPYWKMERAGVLTEPDFGGSNLADLVWPKWIDRSDPNTQVPPTLSPEDIHIVVCGGRSGRFVVCHGWGYGGLAVTKEVKAGREGARSGTTSETSKEAQL